MDIYITSTDMLGTQLLSDFLASNSRKQRTLIIFHQTGESILFSEIGELLNASKSISILPREMADETMFAFQLGRLVEGIERDSKDSKLFTILPEEFPLVDSLKLICPIEEYNSQASKKTTRKKTTKKEEATVEEPIMNEPVVEQEQLYPIMNGEQ